MFIDGEEVVNGQDGKQNVFKYSQPIRYIGNNREGSEPFGTFADLRIYQGLIDPELIEQEALYHHEKGKSRLLNSFILQNSRCQISTY